MKASGQLQAPAILPSGEEASLPIAWETGARAGLDAEGKRKSHRYSCLESNLGHDYTDWTIFTNRVFHLCHHTVIRRDFQLGGLVDKQTDMFPLYPLII
jgi:hypothetical protein